MHPSHLALHKRDPSARDSIATAEPNGDDESNFPHFATWSALQEHNKIEHPPTCPHAECRGRTFKNNKKLRKHCIKFHLETLPQSEEETATAEEEEGGSESAAQESGKIQDAASSHVNLSSKGPSATEDGTGQYTTLDSARDPPLPLSRGSAEPREQNKSSSQVLAGKLRKRNYDGSPSDLLIPTQPNVYGNFDGIDDYDQIEGQQDDEDIVLPANKRVRFA